MRVEEYIGSRIMELCKRHHMSKYRLSQLTGITQTALSNIIKKESLPTLVTLEKICDAFGITMAQFFAGDKNVPDLTEEQREIIDIWSDADSEKRKLILTLIRSIKTS